jgi:Dna[CI] antecedent, DciA
MLKKISFAGLNYRDLDRFDSHDLKKDEMKSFYQTFDFLELIKRWPDIIGPQMAKVTSPLKIRNDSLFIMTQHPSYSQNLSFLSEEIKDKTFKIFPQLRPMIKKLVFQTQESFFKERKVELEEMKAKVNKLHPQSPQYRILKAEADKLFSQIDDTELKNILTSLFIQSRQL